MNASLDAVYVTDLCDSSYTEWVEFLCRSLRLLKWYVLSFSGFWIKDFGIAFVTLSTPAHIIASICSKKRKYP